MALSVFGVFPAARKGRAIPTRLRMGLLALLLTGGWIFAAAQGVSGRIVGVLTDSSGAVVPNGNVTITNQGTGIVTRVVSTERSERNIA